MAENNTMGKLLANTSVVRSVIHVLSKEVMTTYGEVKNSSGSEWRLLSSEEKLIRVVSRLNIVSNTCVSINLVIAYLT